MLPPASPRPGRQPGAEYGEETDVSREAAFALAEHLTGVRLTPELLDESVYLCGVAPVPHAR